MKTQKINHQKSSRLEASLTLSYSGQDVVEGQKFFKIDDRQYNAAVLQAEANLAKSKTALAKELTDLHRYEELWQEQTVSEQTLRADEWQTRH